MMLPDVQTAKPAMALVDRRGHERNALGGSEGMSAMALGGSNGGMSAMALGGSSGGMRNNWQYYCGKDIDPCIHLIGS